MDATWQLLDSSASKPTKQPTASWVSVSEMSGEGVAVIYGGTWVRIGWWPLATKLESFKVIERAGREEALRTPTTSSFMAFLVKLGGAMGKKK